MLLVVSRPVCNCGNSAPAWLGNRASFSTEGQLDIVYMDLGPMDQCILLASTADSTDALIGFTK